MAPSWEEEEDFPKLGSWETVCNLLYPWDQRRWLGDDGQLLSTAGVRSTFLHRAITGKLFQTPKDWQDLQRRLRGHGYSDDLTLLKESMKVQPEEQNDDSERTMAADAKKRTVMDWYDNDDSQTNFQSNIYDHPNKRMKPSLVKTAQVDLADDGTKAKAARDFFYAPHAEYTTGDPKHADSRFGKTFIVDQNVQSDFATPRLCSEQSKNMKGSSIGVSPPEKDAPKDTPRSVEEMDRSRSESSKTNSKTATSSCPGELKDLGVLGGNMDRDFLLSFLSLMNNSPPGSGGPYFVDQLFRSASNSCGPEPSQTNDKATATSSPAPCLGDSYGYGSMTDYLAHLLLAMNDPPPSFGGLYPVGQPLGTASNSRGREPSQTSGKSFASSFPAPEDPGLGDSYAYASTTDLLSQLLSAMNDAPPSFTRLYHVDQPLRTASNSRGPETSQTNGKTVASSSPPPEYPGLGGSYGYGSMADYLRSAMNNPPPSFGGLHPVGQSLRTASNSRDPEPSQTNSTTVASSTAVPGYPDLWDSSGYRGTTDVLSHLRSAMNDPPPSFGGLHPVGQTLHTASNSRDPEPSQTNGTTGASSTAVPGYPGLWDSSGYRGTTDVLSHLRSAMNDPPPTFGGRYPVGQPLRTTSSMPDSRGSEPSQVNCTSAPCPAQASPATVGPASRRPLSSDTDPSETNIKEAASPSPAQMDRDRTDYHSKPDFGNNQSVTGTTTFKPLIPSIDTQKELSATAVQNVSCRPLLIDLTRTEEPSPINVHQDQGNSILSMNFPDETDEKIQNESKPPVVHCFRPHTDEEVALARRKETGSTTITIGECPHGEHVLLGTESGEDELVVQPVLRTHDRILSSINPSKKDKVEEPCDAVPAHDAIVVPFLQDQSKRSVRGVVVTLAASAVIGLLWSLFDIAQAPCNAGIRVDFATLKLGQRIRSRGVLVDPKLETWLGTMGQLSERMNRDSMDRIYSPWHGVMIITLEVLVLAAVWVTITLGILATIWPCKYSKGE